MGCSLKGKKFGIWENEVGEACKRSRNQVAKSCDCQMRKFDFILWEQEDPAFHIHTPVTPEFQFLLIGSFKKYHFPCLLRD